MYRLVAVHGEAGGLADVAHAFWFFSELGVAFSALQYDLHQHGAERLGLHHGYICEFKIC